MKNSNLMFVLMTTLLLSGVVSAQIASGGNYTLEQAVIGSGGGSSAAPAYSIEGTAGQSVAGTQSSAALYSVRSGFWTSGPLAPTAAMVTLSGVVVRGKDVAIKDAVVTLNGGNLTAPRIARSNGLGRFVFDDVEAGHVYILTITHKNYGFAENIQSFLLMDNVEDVTFRADWEN